ncbi:MAG: hypothetical protein GWO04_35825, partial [Actinobacteria bacterium]|nr:hypothetical protein [Actinomycetota bacterium]
MLVVIVVGVLFDLGTEHDPDHGLIAQHHGSDRRVVGVRIHARDQSLELGGALGVFRLLLQLGHPLAHPQLDLQAQHPDHPVGFTDARRLGQLQVV